MQIGVRAHPNGIAWSSEFRTVVQRLVIMSFYLQRGFIHCAPFWKLVHIGNLMKICHILQPSKFVLGHPSRGLFSTTMTRQCPGLSANPGVTDIAHISTLIAHCTLHTVWWLSPPPPSHLPPPHYLLLRRNPTLQLAFCWEVRLQKFQIMAPLIWWDYASFSWEPSMKTVKENPNRFV